MLPFELKKAISTLQSALDGHEKITIASFASKLRKTSSHYPEDQTLGQMSLVVDRMNAGNRLFISRAEVNDLYKKLYSRNTKFAQLFANELGIEAEVEVVPSKDKEEYKELDIYANVDTKLLSDLTSSFDPTATVYSADVAKDAENTVAMECTFSELSPTVKTISGDANCVVVQASYQTSKGISSFFVPVEIVNKRASSPSFFIGKDGSHYISKKSISSYVDNYFNKLGSFGTDIVGEKFSEIPETTVNSDEVENFSSKLSTAKGIAAFQHGDKVEVGRKAISYKMNNFGKQSHQIAILDASTDSVTYGVNCNGLAFKVPVKIESGRLMDPSIIICNGSIESFSAAGINQLERRELTDGRVSAITSPLYSLKPSDLIEVVREAASEENYAKAEDALNVLEYANDEKAYQVAFAEYTASLSGVKKTAEIESKCSRIIKSANSTQPVCGHLNLPLHKVYQDNFGECCPSYRKVMSESCEGSSNLNSKIFQ